MQKASPTIIPESGLETRVPTSNVLSKATDFTSGNFELEGCDSSKDE